jgi:hypothetical protein
MNIFYVDKDPITAAQMLGDKHVIKMILESAQILSTAHRVLDGIQVKVTYAKDGKTRNKNVWVLDDARNDIFYSATHINHPCSKWVRESVENYQWVVEHMFALDSEYKYRFDKAESHKSVRELGYYLQSPPLALKEWDQTNPVCCMPEEYITDDPVESYRNYYRGAKQNLHVWTKRISPDWIQPA